MASSVNKGIILGRIGRDPELRYSQAGKAFCTFSVATNDTYSKSTDWHNVVCFGKTAEAVNKYCAKGSMVYCEGKIQTDKYTDKQGNTRYATKIIAQTVQFLGERPSGVNERVDEQGYSGPNDDDYVPGRDDGEDFGKGRPPMDDTDDVPF